MKPPPAARTAVLDNPVMSTFQSVLRRPGVMSFGAGFMNPAGFDVAGVRAAFAAALADGEAANSLQYGLAEGSPRLRTAIIERMGALGVPAEPDELIVTNIRTLATTVAPGLRVGWVLAPSEVVDVCRPVKQSLDLNTSRVDQAAAAIYLERVDWAVRTAELRAVYRGAMDAMLGGLPAALPAGSSWTRPGGGVFVWVELPDGFSTDELLRRALERGMFFMPGQAFLADVRGDQTLRLSISNHTPDTIAEGLGRLGAAVADCRAGVAALRR